MNIEGGADWLRICKTKFFFLGCGMIKFWYGTQLIGRFEGGVRSPRARFPKLHIEPCKQFEGSRTVTNFIKALLQKNELNNPAIAQYGTKNVHNGG
jgi:hypothetical protein